MNMRKYYHLLSISHKRRFLQHASITPHLTIFTTPLAYVPRHHARFSTSHNLKLPDDERDNRYHTLDYKLSIKNRDVVRATRGLETEYWLSQSNLDLLLPPLQAGVFFCYQRKRMTMSPENVVKTVKKSLGGVLSAFYPLAGEIVANSHGEPEVLCNNVGVEFVHAHADVEMRCIDLHHPDESVKGKLVPTINRGVISVQVTEFKCGSIIISCAFDHRIADGASINMFLIAWAEFTNSAKISNTPSFRRSILNPRLPPRYNAIYDAFYLPISSLPPPGPPTDDDDNLRSRIFYVPAKFINHLQYEASELGAKRSKYESFTAFVWKLLAEEATSEPSTMSRVGVVVNGRRFLNEKHHNHFGNVLSVSYGVASKRELRAMKLNEVANKVHEILSEMTKEEHFRGLIDWVELHRPEPGVARVYFKLDESDGDAVVVSSGQGLPIKDVNFGWGEPDFGSYDFPWGGQTGYITTMPSVKNNGDWVVYAHLKQKQLDLIANKASYLLNPITQSYLGFS